MNRDTLSRPKASKTVKPAASWNVGPQWGEFVHGGTAFVYKLTPTIYEVIFGCSTMRSDEMIDAIQSGERIPNAHPVNVENNPQLGLVVAKPCTNSKYRFTAIDAVQEYEDDFREFLAGPPTTVIAGADLAELPDIEF